MVERKVLEYIISICSNMNAKLMIARRFFVNLNSNNPEDHKYCEDIIKNNSYFKDEKDIMNYYYLKLTQLDIYWGSLKEIDRMNAMKDSDMCRIIFKDVIMDDSEYERRKNDKQKFTT